MARFMLLIRGGDAPESSPAEMQRIVDEYVAWARRLRSEGRLLAADELAPGGKLVTGHGMDLRVTDGPFAETKEAVGGYFLIEVRDEAEAIDISRDCPGLRRGGVVELHGIVEH